MESNDITVHPAKCQVILHDGTIHQYGSQQPVKVNSTACRAIVLRSPPRSMTVWPRDFLEVELPSDVPPDSVFVLEPRTDAHSVRKLTASQLWPHPSTVPRLPVHQTITNHSANVSLDPDNFTPSRYQSKVYGTLG